MNQLFDLARVTTATTGAGAITLGAAVPGYLSFAQAGVASGAAVSYGIADGTSSETGWGIYTAATTTLTRNVYRSTGAGNNTAIALSGAAQVFITALSSDFAGLQTPIAIASGGTGAVTAPAALAALGALPLAGGTMTGALAGTSLTLTTPLAVASGGTGRVTNTSNAILTGGGAGPVNSSLAVVNPLTGNIAAGPNLSLGDGASSTAGIEIAPNRTVDGGSYIDLHATAGAGDYDFRIVRNAGVNGNAEILNLGTGLINIATNGVNRVSFGDLGNGLSVFTTGYYGGAGYQARPGTAGPGKTNAFNIDWTGTSQIWIDNVLQGTINVTCDYRIKENVIDLPSTWDRVKALRPITYTRADNPELLSVADPMERWGFIAHELQETLTETAATGYKDAPNEVQGPDTLAVLAAVTKALQEAMARIESLEAASRHKEDVS